MNRAASSTAVVETAIHWFRNGLRLHDNPSLRDACSQAKHLIPLYIIDPDAPFCQSPTIPVGCIRANFILESLEDLDGQLRKASSSQLVVIRGLPEVVLPKVIDLFQVQALYYEQEVAAPVSTRDSEILEAVRSTGSSACQVRKYPTHTLHPMDKYLSRCPGMVAPKTYGGFTKIFNSLTVPDPVETVSSIPPLPRDALDRLKDELDSAATLGLPLLEELGFVDHKKQLQRRKEGGIDFQGGETAGLALLKHMMQRHEWVAKFEKPDTKPNALTVDTTGLSPYVKHGCVSPRLFYHELSKVYSMFKDHAKPPVSLHGQLMWREYNYLMGYTTPNFDRMVDNPVARQIPWDDDDLLLQAWQNSQTGYPFIDAIMTQLRETGWIHHLARHAVACFLTRGDLWQSWEKGAAYFEEVLIDADWSINNFNWQWLSCTAHFYQYFRCYSPVAFGKKTDPNGDYIRKWLPQFKTFPAKFIYEPWKAPIAIQRNHGVIVGENYPEPIVDHPVISKENRSRMQAAYNANAENDNNNAMTAPDRPRAQTAGSNGGGRKRQRV